MTDLRFGSFLAPLLLPTYEAITEAVGRRLGLTTELVVETSYENCVNDVNDVCFVCSLPYIMFEREGRSPAIPFAAPVLAGDRYRGLPIYFSDVIVHRDSPVRSLLDLRGGRWAYNEPLSHSGYGVVRYHLVPLGETHGFFSATVETGFHSESMRMVREGEVDGAAIDSHVLELAMRHDPQLAADLRIVEALGPSTIQPVSVSQRLSGDLRARLREVFLDIHSAPEVRRLLESGLIERFVAVGPDSYDDIRAMLTACEAVGFMYVK